MNRCSYKRAGTFVLSLFIPILMILQTTLPSLAAPGEELDYPALAEERKSLEIQSNQIENWPAGPAIGAESAPP